MNFRKITLMFLKYVYHSARGITNVPNKFDAKYPDLFLKYPFRNVAIPSFAEPWVELSYIGANVSPNEVKHSLANLGVKPNIERIVGVVVALFEAVYSDNLLKNFQVITDSVMPVQKDIQGTSSPNQGSEVTIEVRPENFRAFVCQFWLQVIGNNNVVQLRYFLSNLLAFNVIPGIIGQVLESETPTDALHLAEQIHNIPGVTKVTEDFSGNAPNYFEFIMIYATERQLDEFYDLLAKAQQMGNIKVDLILKAKSIE
ncbi:hypothetical protein H4R35_000932 [Dimargaris xerosporica]|nr:hypothetical protein H4R35_000932 [Dimargaris xerosporica]